MLNPHLPNFTAEAQLKIMTDSGPVISRISGADRLSYYFNNDWLHFTGQSLAQASGTGWMGGIHPDDVSGFITRYNSCFENQKAYKAGYRLKRYDGTYHWMLDQGTPTYAVDGTFTGYVCTCIDVDELVQTEQFKKDLIISEAVKKEQSLNEELATTNEELSAANEELSATNEELIHAQDQLRSLNAELEDKVTSRTVALQKSEANLQAVNEELSAANEELVATNEELVATNEELEESKETLEQLVSDLAESEQKIRSLVESAPFPIGVYIGKEMRIELANQSIIDVWGKGNDVIGKHYSELLPELAGSGIYEQLDYVYTTGQSHHSRNQRVDLVVDGKLQPFYFNYSFTPLFNAAGEVYGVMNTAAEITDLVTARQQSERNERLFRSVALNIPNSLVLVVDKDHRFMVVEGDMMTQMGFDSKNYEGKHPLEIGPPERYEESKNLYDRMLGGERFSIERKSQRGADLMVHFVPLRDEQQEVYAGLIILLDISDIKKGEERTAMLAAIIESSNDAIVSKSLESIVTSWNNSAERMFGYKAEEMIGQSILKIIPPERHGEEMDIISRVKTGERVEHFETKRVTKDNKLLDLSLTVSPVKNKQGEIIGVSKIARDISDKKQEEARKNDFIAMVSHELKTPLTSMRTYIQVLLSKEKDGGDEFRKNALMRANVQSKKMTSMINDFLSLARLEDGKISLEFEIFDLEPLVEEAVADALFLTTNHNITINGCKDIKIYADRDKIGQVLNNLLSNAIKYSPKGGNITVNCEQSAGKVKVSVNDEGIGINKEDQKKLFKRFFRVQNEKARTVSGFGIGLYLVSEILRYHKSRIEVESEEGKGSTFYFTFETV